MVDYGSAEVIWSGGTTTLLELLKGRLEIMECNTGRDDELALYLDLAGSLAERYIDNKIVLQEVTERFNKYRYPICLRYNPVGALVSVTRDGEDVTAAWNLYHADAFGTATVSPCGYILPGCFEQLDVTYTAGYDPVPTDLAFALVAAGMNYDSESSGSTGGVIKRESITGIGSVEYAVEDVTQSGGLPGSVTSVLDKYRRLHA